MRKCCNREYYLIYTLLLRLSCCWCPGASVGPCTLPGTGLCCLEWPTDRDCHTAPNRAAPFLWLCSHLALSCDAHGSSCKHLRTKTHIQVLTTGFPSVLCTYHFELYMHSIAGCPWFFAFLLASSVPNTVLLRVENKCLAPCLWQNTELMSSAPYWGPFCYGLHRQISHLDANICPCSLMQCINHIAVPYQLIVLA